MTMADHKCEVCLVNEPLGVACTVLPYSVAYCAECARRFAQPRIVFEMFFEEAGTDISKLEDESFSRLVTFHDGKYITYAEWAVWRKGQIDEDSDISA